MYEQTKTRVFAAISESDFNTYGCPSGICDDGKQIEVPGGKDTWTTIRECWCCEKFFAVVKDGVSNTTFYVLYDEPGNKFMRMLVRAHPTRVPR